MSKVKLNYSQSINLLLEGVKDTNKEISDICCHLLRVKLYENNGLNRNHTKVLL